MTEPREKPLVLLIDDDDLLLSATRRLLKLEGYAVECRSNAFGATKLITEIEPDLVLLDMNMPALSGASLAQLVKDNERAQHTKIVFFSSNDEESLRAAVEATGVEGYICKGDVEELRRKVSRFVEQAA